MSRQQRCLSCSVNLLWRGTVRVHVRQGIRKWLKTDSADHGQASDVVNHSPTCCYPYCAYLVTPYAARLVTLTSGPIL